METEKIIELINAERLSKGQEILLLNIDLQTAADKKVLDMRQNDYFAHLSGSSKSISDFVPASYNYYALGENLAFGYNDESSLVSAWMKSETHRGNILFTDYQDTAVSVLEAEGSFLVAQVFGLRQSVFVEQPDLSNPSFYNQNVGANIFLEAIFYFSTAMFMMVSVLLIVRKVRLSG